MEESKSEPPKIRTIDIKGNMQYMIDFSAEGKFTARYELTVDTQLIAMMIVNETLLSALKAEASRPKNQKYAAEERRRMKGATVQIQKIIGELATYIHETESKKPSTPKIQLLK